MILLFPSWWFAANALHATNNLQIIPDFSLKDSMDQTVLGLALWTGRQQFTKTKYCDASVSRLSKRYLI